MQCTFEHLSGSKKGQLEQIEGDRITIGRNPANALNFDPMIDLDVSGDHAQLQVGNDGKYMLTDVGSKNGTFVNGTKIAGSIPVEPGSKIQFGKNGPEVKIMYTPGPKKGGETRVMLAQVQQQMATERVQAARSKKMMVLIIAIVAVLGIGGVVTYGLVSSASAKKAAAIDAQAAAADMAQKAKDNKANNYAAAQFMQASDLEAQGLSAFEAGDYVTAKEKLTLARKQYETANDMALRALFDKAGTEARQQAAEAQKRQLEEMKRQQAAREAELQAAEEKRKRDLAEVERKLAAASAADRAELDKLRDKLSQKPDSELAREIISKNEPSICYIHVESYVQAPGSKERSPIATSEGTGFVITPDLIATAKHVVQPWKYDPKVLATAKKIKEEHGLDVHDYVEIHMGKGKEFAKRFDTASGSCKILKVMPDKKVEKAEVVQIEWNAAVTAVPGIQVHERNVNDLALLQVPQGGLKPCALAQGPAQKFDAVLVLGTVRETAGKRLISASPARAEVQTTTGDVFSINATVPATFSGCPVFKYDGRVYGVVAGTEGSNLICLPIEQVAKLKGGGGGSTAPAGGSAGNLPAGQDPGAGAPGSAAPEDD